MNLEVTNNLSVCADCIATTVDKIAAVYWYKNCLSSALIGINPETKTTIGVCGDLDIRFGHADPKTTYILGIQLSENNEYKIFMSPNISDELSVRTGGVQRNREGV